MPLRAGTAVQRNRGTIGAADGRILDIMSCFETGECPAAGALVSPCPSMIGDRSSACNRYREPSSVAEHIAVENLADHLQDLAESRQKLFGETGAWTKCAQRRVRQESIACNRAA